MRIDPRLVQYTIIGVHVGQLLLGQIILVGTNRFKAHVHAD